MSLFKTSQQLNILQDDWTKLDQRVWHAVAMDQPAKLATKLNKHDVNINKLCPSVGYSMLVKVFISSFYDRCFGQINDILVVKKIVNFLYFKQ